MNFDNSPRLPEDVMIPSSSGDRSKTIIERQGDLLERSLLDSIAQKDEEAVVTFLENSGKIKILKEKLSIYELSELLGRLIDTFGIGSNSVIEYIFKLSPHQESVALLLLDADYPATTLGRLLDKFENLSMAFADRCLKQGIGIDTLFDSIKNFRVEDQPELIKKVIESEMSDDPDEVATPPFYSTSSRIDSLMPFTPEIAETLLDTPYQYCITKHLEELKDHVDEDFLLHLAKGGCSEHLLVYLIHHPEFDHDLIIRTGLASKCTHINDIHFLAYRLTELQVSSPEIASFLIRFGAGDAVLLQRKKFSALSEHDLIFTLLERDTYYYKKIFQFFSQFSEATKKEILAYYLCPKHYQHLLESIKFIDASFHPMIAEAMIGIDTPSLISHIEQFIGVNKKDILEKILAGKNYSSIIDVLDLFPSLDQNALAHRLIDDGKDKILVDQLGKFRGLELAIATQLLTSSERATLLAEKPLAQIFGSEASAIIAEYIRDKYPSLLRYGDTTPSLLRHCHELPAAFGLFLIEKNSYIAILRDSLINFRREDHEAIAQALLETNGSSSPFSHLDQLELGSETTAQSLKQETNPFTLLHKVAGVIDRLAEADKQALHDHIAENTMLREGIDFIVLNQAIMDFRQFDRLHASLELFGNFPPFSEQEGEKMLEELSQLGFSYQASHLIACMELVGYSVPQEKKKQIEMRAVEEKQRRKEREPQRTVPSQPVNANDQLILFYVNTYIEAHTPPQQMIDKMYTELGIDLPFRIRVEVSDDRHTANREHQKLFEWLRCYCVYAVASELKHQHDVLNLGQQSFDHKRPFGSIQTGPYRYVLLPRIALAQDVEDRPSFNQDDEHYIDHFLTFATEEEIKEYLFRARQRFADEGWSHFYGGEAWEQIARSTLRTWQQSDWPRDVLIDHIFDLEHNTGMIFDKRPDRVQAKNNSMKAFQDFKAREHSLEEWIEQVKDSTESTKLADRLVERLRSFHRREQKINETQKRYVDFLSTIGSKKT